MDDEQRYRAVSSRDARFDGVFYTCVTTTRIYCRPSCPAVTPRRENVRFAPSAAAAQAHGFRACKRCRPDAVPGSPEWNERADAVGRAMRLLADGAVDRDGVGGLAAALGYSERQLNRMVTAELGAGPLALARARRARTARILIETTALPMGDIAFAAGFTSIRQFNDTVREVFAESPTRLRSRAHAPSATAPSGVPLRLPFRRPFADGPLFAFLAARAVPGVEEVDARRYRRALALPHGPGVVEVDRPAPGTAHMECRLHLTDLRDLGTAVHRCRRLFDLDTDPDAVAAVLSADPLLAPAVAAVPGLRAPGAADAAEYAARIVVGQQVSVASARTVAGRIAADLGTPLPPALAAVSPGVQRLFPSPAVLAGTDPAQLPLPRSRARGVRALAAALTLAPGTPGSVDLGAGADRDEAAAALLALPGIGPWTADAVRMRVLGDPDVLLHRDLVVRDRLHRLGASGSDAALAERGRAWGPYRSYATHYLWHAAVQEDTERTAP
ncbi:DNA-3-methyladenine glycosylase 2 family protein [Nocardiopsis coralliicola]